MTSLISVHSSAYRRSALVTTIGSRVYVLLPDLPERSAVAAALSLTREIVTAAKQHLRAKVQVGVGSAVRTLDEVAESRTEADWILDAMTHDLHAEIATISDVRAQVVISEILTVLQGNERFRDSRLTALYGHDAEHGTDLARSLLAYLEAFGDVRAASDGLHVHPNTLRYRIRRAGEITGIDFSNATERLSAHLQLLLSRRAARR